MQICTNREKAVKATEQKRDPTPFPGDRVLEYWTPEYVKNVQL